jgi:catechol 2,3-dioxygenase-like lactoylglutathione lyase family enzyme
MKTHIALNTPRFDESVRFYRAFLGVAPTRLISGFAKFEVTEPELNLTLSASADTGAGALHHLGVQLSSSEALRATTDRLRAEKLATIDEEDISCCHSLQHKVWVTDPNGYKWEVFVEKTGAEEPQIFAEGASCCPTCCHS